MVDIGDGKPSRKKRTQKAANVPGDNTRMGTKQEGLISVGPDGEEIPTGRSARGGLWGDIDPPNTRMYRILEREMDVSELDDDELSKGITKCDDGKFSAHAAYQKTRLPSWVKHAMEKELVNRAESMLAGSLLGSMDTMVSIATGTGRGAGADLAQQAKAAQWVVERTLGKTPDRVAVSADKPFELLFDRIEATARQKVQSERVAELEAEQAPIDGVDRDAHPLGDGDGVDWDVPEEPARARMGQRPVPDGPPPGPHDRPQASQRRGVGHPEDHAEPTDAEVSDD